MLNTNGDIKQVAARLTSPVSGITLEVYTDEPGIQVYSGNFFRWNSERQKKYCIQSASSYLLGDSALPDSPNKPEWPSVLLEPDKTYRSHCIFKFTVNK